VSQYFASVFTYHDIVFDSHTSEAGDVDTGFNRYDISSAEDIFAFGGKSKRLMNLDAEPMTERMAEVLPVTRIPDVLAGNPIQEARRDS
jgi:hypothetical protein